MTDIAYFKADTFQGTIYLPRLHELPITNIRKLFRLVFRYDWENEDAILTTGLYIENAVEDSKQAWDAASIRFQREWRLIEKPTGRQTKAQIQAASKLRAHNNELTKAVKEAKRTHEQWVKINALFHEYKP